MVPGMVSVGVPVSLAFAGVSTDVCSMKSSYPTRTTYSHPCMPSYFSFFNRNTRTDNVPVDSGSFAEARVLDSAPPTVVTPAPPKETRADETVSDASGAMALMRSDASTDAPRARDGSVPEADRRTWGLYVLEVKFALP